MTYCHDHKMKVGDLVKWSTSDIGLVLDIGTGDGAGLVYVEWVFIPEHSGYIPVEEPMLEVINESR